MTEILECPACGKPAGLCICDRVHPVDTRLRVAILQHPQEKRERLGTSALVTATLPRAEVRVGLSWPSLEAALGRPGAEPERWAVLSVAKLPAELPAATRNEPVVLIDRRGRVLDRQHHRLEGIVVLDGTWSQAKTLWWRNAWLLKLPRIVLRPLEPSMYGRLRREPRREWVSTLEAVADTLPALGEAEAVRTELRRLLRTLLQRARDAGK